MASIRDCCWGYGYSVHFIVATVAVAFFAIVQFCRFIIYFTIKVRFADFLYVNLIIWIVIVKGIPPFFWNHLKWSNCVPVSSFYEDIARILRTETQN